jgi:hypothetical protein
VIAEKASDVELIEELKLEGSERKQRGGGGIWRKEAVALLAAEAHAWRSGALAPRTRMGEKKRKKERRNKAVLVLNN